MEQTTALPMVKDPVCGMDVLPGTARGWDYLFESVVYHFCGPECRSRFGSDPKGILGGVSTSPSAMSLPDDSKGRHPFRALVDKLRAALS